MVEDIVIGVVLFIMLWLLAVAGRRFGIQQSDIWS